MIVAIHGGFVCKHSSRIHRHHRRIRQKTREVASDFILRGNKRKLRQSLCDAKAFIVHEEKRSILDDRASKRRSKLILVVGLAAGIERIPSVDRVISKELVNIAVEAVRPGLDDGVENRAISSSKFRTVRVGLYFEFLYRIYGRLNHVRLACENVSKVRVIVHAIEQIIVLKSPRAIRTESITGFHARTRLARNNSRSQQGKLCVITAIQRQRDRSFTANHLAEVRSLRLQQRRLRNHRNSLSHV